MKSIEGETYWLACLVNTQLLPSFERLVFDSWSLEVAQLPLLAEIDNYKFCQYIHYIIMWRGVLLPVKEPLNTPAYNHFRFPRAQSQLHKVMVFPVWCGRT